MIFTHVVVDLQPQRWTKPGHNSVSPIGSNPAIERASIANSSARLASTSRIRRVFPRETPATAGPRLPGLGSVAHFPLPSTRLPTSRKSWAYTACCPMSVATTPSRPPRPNRGEQRGSSSRTWGLAQLSLVEHALCPLDRKIPLSRGFEYSTGFYYGRSRQRRFANVTVTAARGISPNDEFFLWGLLALTLAEEDEGVEFWATPYHCLRRLGYSESYRSQGGSQYQLFNDSLMRLSHVVYWSDAFYNPVRCEHLERTMGFLKFERPVNPQSSRQCRVVWDPLFLEFCRATAGGRLFFDLELYRQLDFASRRLFLLLHKLFGGKRGRTSPAYDVRHLAVHVLGFAEHLPLNTLKRKLSRVIERMIDLGAIALPVGTSRVAGLFSKRAKGIQTLAFSPGPYFTDPTMDRSITRHSITDSPLYDPLHAIGFADAEIGRVLRSFPKGKLQVWSDVTLRAMEGAPGFPGFKKDPKAFFLHHIKQAKENNRTPPDWWHAARKDEDRRRCELERRSDSADGDRAAAYWEARQTALREYLADHQEEFDRLLEIFIQMHSGSMSMENAYHAAQTDAQRQMEGRFRFPAQEEWPA